MNKTRLNLAMDNDLILFMRNYAKNQRTTITDLFTQYTLSLMRAVTGEGTPCVIYDPAFNKAMEEIRTTAQSGKAKWYNYQEVFGEDKEK